MSMSRIFGICVATFSTSLLATSLLAQSIEFVRQPLECYYYARTEAWMDPGSGRPELLDEDEYEGGIDYGVISQSSVYTGEGGADIMSSIAVAPDSAAMSINGYSTGTIGLTWPDQVAHTYYSDRATVVYRLTTTDVPPDATFTLTAEIEFQMGGYLYSGLNGGIYEIYRGIGTEGDPLMSVTVSGNTLIIKLPDGTTQYGFLPAGAASYNLSKILVTDAKDGDFFTIVGGDSSWSHDPVHGPAGEGEGSTMTWAITVTSDQN